jgi:dTDP-4-amino-4,6-dideoxygalactose transaminase
VQSLTKIPYIDLTTQHEILREEILSAVSDVLKSGDFIFGTKVPEFEKAFASSCKRKYALGVNSGTDALILSLRALGIGPGDEVITASNSYYTTASSIGCVGAKPVFVDVRKDYNIDPSLIEAAITPNTKAIIPVHLTGRPAEMREIMRIAHAHKLFVIEDVAQAVDAEIYDQKVGSFGDLACYSFHPLKNLNACGDGGAILLDDQALYEKLRILRDNGIYNRDYCKVWSGNSRLDAMQAAILSIKLKYLPEVTNQRRKNAKLYRELLSGIKEVYYPQDEEYMKSVYHIFVIQAERRDELKNYLAEQGIGTRIHYPIPIHLQEAAKDLGYSKGSLPVTEYLSERILSLPVYQTLAEDNIRLICKTIREFYQEKK